MKAKNSGEDNVQPEIKLAGMDVYKVVRKNKVIPKPAGKKKFIILLSQPYRLVLLRVFIVFHSGLNILTTSLGDFTRTKENKEIFSVLSHLRIINGN